LYEGQSGARRDAGFSIFYMGINLGAFIAPLIAGTLGEAWNWRVGFFFAGLAMLIGVVQYKFTEQYLGHAGLAPQNLPTGERSRSWRVVLVAGGLIVLLGALLFAGVIPVSIQTLAQSFVTAMVALAVAFFGYVLFFADLTTYERKRVAVIAVFFLAAAVFWAGFEQAATTFNLFTQDFTDRSWFGRLFPDGMHPASWYQSANPIFIIVFAPFFAWLWVALGRRNLDPSAPAKFGLGLVLLGVGFLIMMFAAQLAASTGSKVAPTWMLLTYLLHTFGELCLSPVGLSNVTKLSPQRYVGQMMGTWFLGAAVGNLIAGLLGGHIGSSEVGDMPGQFLQMALVGGGAGILLLLLSRPLANWMGNARPQQPNI